jgi:hypothetical protein
MMQVNVKGAFLSMKYDIPELLRSGGGSLSIRPRSEALSQAKANARIRRASMPCKV